MQIILPKTLVKTDPRVGPLFFLAGPVRGGGDWQYECCKELERQNPYSDFYAVIPYYHKTLSPEHPLLAHKVQGDEDHFERQLNWERHYLDLASKVGSVIFWLPAESTTDPRIGGGPYATDTRGEVGEWRGRLIGDPTLHVVVGGEPDFPCISQIERNFKLGVSQDFPFYSTLKETVTAAIEMIQ